MDGTLGGLFMRKMNFKSILAIALSMVMAFPVSVSATEDGFTREEDLSENAGEDLAEEVTATLPKEETVGDSAAVPEILSYGGGFESIYATIANVSDEQVTAVSYEGTMSGQLSGDDLKYLVRDDKNGNVRVDIPGLKKDGVYNLKITANNLTMTCEEIHVRSYDRSGYAHFNYNEGVGAYNDDGTLKDNAIVLYVTDENKNDVKLTVGSKEVTGIGNILNSAGASGSGKKNTNNGIIKELAKKNIPLAVRIIGSVKNLNDTSDPSSEALIQGLTAYDSADYGGSKGDNGGMARMKGGKNITIEGIGTDAVADGWGFHFIAEDDYGKSFELRNLTFRNTPEDAVGMEGVQSGTDLTAPVERCWIHNNEFYGPSFTVAAENDKHEGDGSCDFKRGQYLTVDYNYFEGCHKTCLVGSDDSSLQFNLTYHHNYWYLCDQRGPLARRANIHMYNNFFFGQTSYAMNTRADAYIYSEYNLFYMCKNPSRVDGGAIKSFEDNLSGCIDEGKLATSVEFQNEEVENNCRFSARNIDYSNFDADATLSYIPDDQYRLQNNMSFMRKEIYAYAGVMKEWVDGVGVVKTGDISVISRFGVVPEKVWVKGGEKWTKVLNKQKTMYAFSIPTECDVTIQYASEDPSKTGVLIDETGKKMHQGSITIMLPAGNYAVHSVNHNPGNFKTKTLGSFKEMATCTITVSSTDPNYDPAEYMSVKYAVTDKEADDYEFTEVTVEKTATVADLIYLAQIVKDVGEVKMASNGGYETVAQSAVLTENGQYVIIFKKDEYKVDVNVNSVTLDPAADFELNVDETKTITATVKPDNATDKTVTWKSSVPGVATVDGGVVTAKAEGETVISATAGGESASLKVTVKKPSGGQSGEGGGQSGDGGGQSGEGGGQSGEGGGQSGEGGGQSGEGGGQSGEVGGQSGEGGGESGGGDKPVPVPVPVPDTKVKLPVTIGEKTYNVEYTDKPQFTGAKITLSDITFEGAKPGEVIPGTAVLFKSVKYKNNKNAGKNASAVIVLKAQKMEDKAANAANKAAVKAANNAFKANPIIFEIAQRPLASDKISGTAEYNAKRSSWKFKLSMDVSGAKPLKLKFNKKAEKTDFTVDPAFAPGEDGSYPATVKLTGSNNFTGSADVNVTVRQ